MLQFSYLHIASGWTLPANGVYGDAAGSLHASLIAAGQTGGLKYGGCTSFQGVYSGYYSGNNFYNQGVYGEYWYATARSGTEAYTIYINRDGYLGNSYGFKNIGFAVRCYR